MKMLRSYLWATVALTLFSLPTFAQTGAAEIGSDLAASSLIEKLRIHDTDLLERGRNLETGRDWPSTFIVALTADASQVDRLADELREDYGVVVHKTWTRALVGLLVEADLETATLLAADGRVRFVEQNMPLEEPLPISGLERPEGRRVGGGPPHCFDNDAAPFPLNPYPASSPTISWGKGCPAGPNCTGNWGLDRIDDRKPGLDGTYQPMSGPHAVDVFIIETTVDLNHQELSQNPSDQVFIDGSTGPQRHGTHVAGILVGKNFGVAQDNIRFHVLSFGTSVTLDRIVSGFEMVLANRVAGVPAVVSLSANGAFFPGFILGDVVRRVIAADILVVNSAGNLRRPQSCADANDPAEKAEHFTLAGDVHPKEVLIVGATDDQDRVYCECDGPPNGFNSDCGSRVGSPGKIDLFAPGADIVSMSIQGTNTICHLSGTSMAAPHAAGAAALLLSRFPDASPRAIHRGLRKMATKTIVKDHNGNLVTNGRLLYVGDDFTEDQPVAGHKWYFAEAGETLSIPKSDLVRSSFDWEDRPLQVTAVHTPLNGQLVDRGSFVDFTLDADARAAIDERSSASFRFEVSNGLEVGFGMVWIVVQPSAPPVAAISVSGANLEYTFDGRASTDDEGIVSYEWEFPGGVQKTGPVVSHLFPSYHDFPGLLETVKLTVTDADGWTHQAVEMFSLFQQPNVTPRAGHWYNPDRSGHGISFYRNGADQYVLTWYTYLPDGTPIWYLSDAAVKTRGATWTAPLYKVVTWNGASTTPEVVGRVRLSFDDPRDAWFAWTLNGESGGERFRFHHGGSGAGGLWYAPSSPGWGLTVDDGYSHGVRTMISAVTFYEDSEPRWVQGVVPYSPNADTPVYWLRGPGLCPSCNGNSPPTFRPAGSIRVEIPTPNSGSGFLSTDIETPLGFEWNEPRLPIEVLTLSY
ncbi:MAG: S8 family serine peptidase [Acidobacteriota bacterium]